MTLQGVKGRPVENYVLKSLGERLQYRLAQLVFSILNNFISNFRPF